MERYKLRMTALIHQSLWGLVVFADLHQLGANMSLPEMGAQSTLPIVYVNHDGPPRPAKGHVPCHNIWRPTRCAGMIQFS
jgi:hypothetical protein